MPTPVPWRSRLVERDAGYVTPCLEWSGARRHGYGAVQIAGRQWQVHRLAWAEAHGDPGPLYVLHRCDNPPCARLDHLFLGEQALNIADADAKGRLRSRGTHNAQAKLSDDDITAIRRASESQAVIAARFGVSQSTISLILNRKRWSHHGPDD